MNALRTVSVPGVGKAVMDCRSLPRPHVALGIGRLDPLGSGLLESIRRAAEATGVQYIYSDIPENVEDSLWRVGESVFSLVDAERPLRPQNLHPALAFRRLWDAVVANTDERFVVVIGPIDEIEASPNSDNILAALRSAAIRYESRVQVVFLVRNWIIRQQIFWLSRPTEELAIFVDVRDFDESRA